MTVALPPALHGLIRNQLGLVTRAQLTEAGFSGGALRRRLAAGTWRMVLPGVIQPHPSDLDDHQRLVAAQLAVGPEGIVTGPAAARWHGLRYSDADERIDVLVGVGRAARTTGFVTTHRTDRTPVPLYGRGAARVAPVARAVADACRFRRGERYATALVIEATQRGLCSLQNLADELHAGPHRGSADLRRAVVAGMTGAWSAPEHDLIRLVTASASLPTPWANPVLHLPDGRRLPSPDLWFDDVGLAVQVHSREHHSAAQDWVETVRADSALTEAGVLRVAVAPREITRSPAATLARIERAHASRGPADRPPVTMHTRGPALR